MPNEDKTTNTNQPPTEGVPTVGQPDPTTTPTPTPSPTTTPDVSGQVIDAPPPPPMEDGAVSPPPPIVEEKKPEETTAPIQETGAAENTQTIPNIPPVITTSGAGGKKPVGKKMIATILGVLVLVGGIGAGVILVQNQQDIREKAAVDDGGAGGGNACTSAGGACYSSASCSRLNRTTVNGGNGCNTLAGEICCSKTIISDPKSTPTATPKPTATSTPKGIPSTCLTQTPNIHIGDYGYCGWEVCKGLIDGKPICSSGCTCPQSAPSCTGKEVPGTPGGSFASKFCVGPGEPTTSPTSTPKSTLPPGISAACLNIKAFDTEWNEITSLSSLVAGDIVRFTVSGNANSGSFSKARFKINGTLRPEVSVKRPSTSEFYDEYTIPENVTTFTINAEIHHSGLGWF